MTTNPAEDPKITPGQMQALQTLFGRVVQLAAKQAGWDRTCLSCMHFDEARDVCVYYTTAMRPPARVIVETCPAYDELPF